MFGFIGAAIGAIGSCIGGAISSIGSICGSIGGAVMGGIRSLATGLLGVITEQPRIFDTIGLLGKILGIGGDRPEELGMKIAQGKERPEDFQSIQEYIDHYKDVEIDKEKLEKLSDEEKLLYGTLGSCAIAKGIEEKLDMKDGLSVDFWKAADKTIGSGKLSPEEMKDTLVGMKERGLKTAEGFSNYMDGKANMEEQMIVFDSLKDALRKEFPDLSDAELNVKTSHIKDFVAENK